MLPVPGHAQTQVMNGVDDGTYHVNLGHTFPYYGGVFTDAWMSSNGFIMLYDPTSGFGNSNTWNNGCCSGFNPSGQGRFSYMLAPLWTDLVHITSVPDSGYFYETDSTGSSFLWQNIAEFYNANNLNTFGVQLWPDGSFDFHYADVNITNHSTWIGFTGDTEYVNPQNIYEEVNQIFYKTQQEGGMTMDHVANFASVVNETENGTYAAWYGQDGGYDSNQVFGPDCSDPLNDTSCEGYEEAYFAQQCDANPLYDSMCPGYEQAYFDQQCSSDTLYDSACPGYAEAYYDQQCSEDALYDSGCPGYAEAYYDQQCSIDALYDSGCTGYAEAYYNQQCTIDALYDSGCTGYAEAYLDQQCELDPLSSPSCPNYATESALLALEETILNNTQDVSYDTGSVSFEEEFTPTEEDMSTFEENMYMSEEQVDEIDMVEEIFEPIEEEIAILEDLEVVDVMEEEILVEELEETLVNEEISEPTATRSNNSLAISLSVAMANDLVSKLEEKAQSNEQNTQENQQNTQSSAIVVENSENSSVTFDVVQENSEISTSGDIFSSDTELFFSMVGESQAESTESVAQDTTSVSSEQNVQQNLALGDAAPIGFSIVPMEMPSMQGEIVEEKSLAETMAEAVAEKNKENSNKAAIGQTAMLSKLASGTDFGQYYNTAYETTKTFYVEEKIYEDVTLTDNIRTHYNMFSNSHGTMYQLIRSQYE